MSTVEKADKILLINKGRVEQIGSHKELLKQDGMYRLLVQRQIITDSTKNEKHTEKVNKKKFFLLKICNLL